MNESLLLPLKEIPARASLRHSEGTSNPTKIPPRKKEDQKHSGPRFSKISIAVAEGGGIHKPHSSRTHKREERLIQEEALPDYPSKVSAGCKR